MTHMPQIFASAAPLSKSGQQGEVAQAVRLFEELRELPAATGGVIVGHCVSEINRILQKNGLDHAALDPKGEHSAEVMKQELSKRVHTVYNGYLRLIFPEEPSIEWKEKIKQVLGETGPRGRFLEATGQRSGHTVKKAPQVFQGPRFQKKEGGRNPREPHLGGNPF